MTVTVDDRAFQADFRKALGEFDARGRKAARGRAESIATRARSLVHVESGDTLASIEVIEVDGGTAYDVRAGATALFEEFGTSIMSPRPFLRPAVAEER